jgi:arylformamidase
VKIFDISLPVSPEMPVWPGDSQIALEVFRAIAKGDISNDSRLSCSVHSGTHVDAPLHFIERGTSVDQLPLDTLIGPSWVAEVPAVDVITADVLDSLALPSGTTRLLFKTSNSALWSNSKHRFNPDFVALSSDAAEWLTGKAIRLVGVDYLSVQKFNDPDPSTHRILLKAGVVVVEGLNLLGIRPGHYQFICLPLKLVRGDGAPARAVLVED